MKGVAKRMIAMLLAWLLAFSALFSLPVFAVEGEEESRFVFEALVDGDEGTYAPQDGRILLPLSPDALFTAKELQLLSGNTNAVYISFLNSSAATALRVTVTYELYGEILSESVEQTISPYSKQKQSHVLHLPHVTERVRTMELSFVGAKSGETLELQAFFNLSTYLQEEDKDAIFTRCHYNEQTGEIEIKGELSYAATVRYEGESLALFALAPGEDLHLSSKTPIARTGISFDFSFSVSVARTGDLFLRYVVAAVTSAGERVPLCTPTYPTLQATQSSTARDFKGLATQSFETMMEATPDMAVVDVYLDRMQGTQNGGILYAGEYDYYYFNQSYVAELDKQIKNLSGIAADVYLRILVDPTATGLSFVDEAPSGVVNRLPVVRNEAAQRDLFALIDFLSARYADKTTLCGLILGRSADLAATYSFTAADDLAEYSELYASTLHLIAGCARRNISGLRVILPVSDRVWDENASSLQGTRDSFVALFLPSLLRAMNASTLEPQSFGVMLESYTLCDRWGALNGRYGIDHIDMMTSALQNLARTNSYLSSDLIFCWLPDASEDAAVLRADYLLKYGTLYLNSAVSSFLVDFSLDESGMAVSALSHLVRYVDTNQYEQAATTALAELGVKSIQEIYPELAQTPFLARHVYRAEFSTTAPDRENAPLGSYPLWDFTDATGVMDWYAGVACTSLSVLGTDKGGHALTASISGKSTYGDMAFHFNTPVNLSFAPMIAMELGVFGTEGTRYELQIRFIGTTSVAYAAAVLSCGESSTLYLDLSQTALPLTELKCVRVMARPLDGQGEDYTLQLGSVVLQSHTLNKEQLAERVDALRQSETVIKNDGQQRDYSIPMLLTGGVLLASAVIVGALWLGRRTRLRRAK